MKMQTRRGQQLIDVLVLLAILAILAAIFWPVFDKARDRQVGGRLASEIVNRYTELSDGSIRIGELLFMGYKSVASPGYDYLVLVIDQEDQVVAMRKIVSSQVYRGWLGLLSDLQDHYKNEELLRRQLGLPPKLR